MLLLMNYGPCVCFLPNMCWWSGAVFLFRSDSLVLGQFCGPEGAVIIALYELVMTPYILILILSLISYLPYLLLRTYYRGGTRFPVYIVLIGVVSLSQDL